MPHARPACIHASQGLTIATPATISIICRLFKLHATNVRLKLVVSQLFVSAASLSNAHWPACRSSMVFLPRPIDLVHKTQMSHPSHNCINMMWTENHPISEAISEMLLPVGTQRGITSVPGTRHHPSRYSLTFDLQLDSRTDTLRNSILLSRPSSGLLPRTGPRTSCSKTQ